MRYDSTTGLSSGQVTELVARIFQILSGRSSLPGHPAVLNLRKQVIVTLLLLRQNLNQAAVADLHGVSQATVSRIYRRIVPLIEQACCFSGISLEEAVQGRVVLVDGTDVPTRNRAEAGRSNYSGKRHRQGLNVQIAADLDGRYHSPHTIPRQHPRRQHQEIEPGNLQNPIRGRKVHRPPQEL
ncbi:transposase, partial [Rathayibacter rathayi NCPPB 2980 = VKM Ac-1601]|nr:transposase [Rathayibacter rathayi NCPPB 2980 = VKM Ac-1601]